MRVSVVLCTYSLEMYDHFQEAAESVLDQTYDETELVVVVDGTDEVYDRAVEDYGDHDNVVVHCNEENVGLLESRNTGAELADGDVVAFIDDDAVANEEWVEELVRGYEEQDTLAVGGKMIGNWVAGRPSFLPEEFYWLVGVTHLGFADGPGWVRNTFGSNISFDREAFLELGGFDTDIGGRKGDANLQGGETELCARLAIEHGEPVWYNPDATVAHKVFEYRTEPLWLLDRAFWQGYSKRAMETLVPGSGGEEGEFLRDLIVDFVPRRVKGLAREPSVTAVVQLLTLLLLTGCVGGGYLYGLIKYQ
ncbi:glucosyl-dolichyl phosphate glucuronosyltransferase [Halorubrum ezzemoulense]|uniref:glucosyl-dolichyl phosphate glucuronosyltransferase n=1 Tax=Halorubrum ezzemoulense TaxID=337243 RepID=UPI00232F1AAC|nr:glucosyl-dolichyl phosphate glucuronosyltransferase [Halorubrum ezzemoulense]MDB2225258.1 glucosyl-dolichyl phosphate glucuronosyltransferase [Halorubrum ezzemoulense]MDB2236980.1 glucosyl-dolichyl phosphate glucuronosyltransferase [Halorubrum ezzemoulense]MDB2241494.1 glucosyl-dolichyl phosphate glucuronosyltransferase [Halorubrum ezzemoulense]MDB2247031.1 glucosyl-dolichyl phosphate glucuronosyltransferase [Halorubrum ezzemoulense]